MSKKIVSLILTLMMLVLISGCNEEVVATVNGENITAEALDRCFELERAQLESYNQTDFSGEEGQKTLDNLKITVLDEMINNRVVVQEAKKTVTLTKEQIEQVLTKLKTQGSYTTDEDFEKSFEQFYGVSKEDYAYIYSMQEKLASEVPQATEAAAMKFYEDNLNVYFSKQEQFFTRHILYLVEEGKHNQDEAWALAMGAINRLNAGADFAELASNESEDLASKSSGGEYRFSDDGTTVPEYIAATRGLVPGQHTLFPIQTQYGFHVIKLEEMTPPSTVPFEEEKENILTFLTNSDIQNYINTKMIEARDQAVVVNKLADAAAKAEESATPATTEQPPATQGQPPATTEQPPATTEQPPATQGQPPATTEQPPATTEQPPATTEQPPVTQGQPPATTGQ